eukprot:5698719-Pyramimonas_sp.AAC.1
MLFNGKFSVIAKGCIIVSHPRDAEPGVSTGGTLSTVSADEDKWPIGTYVRYVLDADGLPIFRLRPGAVHTENLAVDNRCSLHVRPHGTTKSMTARTTLVGRVASIDQSSDEGSALVQAYLDKVVQTIPQCNMKGGNSAH